ncbi:MAG: putative histidine kinase, classic [Verrucomicrobiales bacterium]|nr:putative histidine kinase, classic [Verrucomicrobiales bacterium]
MEAFNYSIAHDLRSPLRAMTGFTEALLLDYAPSLDATAVDYLQRIDRGAKRMDLLVNDLLAFGRLAHVDLPLQKVSFEAIASKVIGDLSGEIERQKAEVQVQLPLLSVVANQTVLHQLILNLISNALKFIPAAVSPRVLIRSDARAGAVRLWIEDNGIGIAPDHQMKIFEVFNACTHTSNTLAPALDWLWSRKELKGWAGVAERNHDCVRGAVSGLNCPRRLIDFVPDF